jgi:hypothetical protein
VTEAQAIEAIYERWQTGWTALHPADVPFTFDNEAFEAPTKWARVAVRHTTRPQISLGPPGSRRFEARGYIAVQLFADVNNGRGELAGLADDVRTVLESQLVTGTGSDAVYTYGSATNEVTSDGRWAMSLVLVPFMYHQVR